MANNGEELGTLIRDVDTRWMWGGGGGGGGGGRVSFLLVKCSIHDLVNV